MICLLFSINTRAQITYNIGSATSTSSSSAMPCPLQDYNEASRSQYLYLASELSAAGMTVGNILGVKFNVTALNGFSGSIENYTIKIGDPTYGLNNWYHFNQPGFALNTVFGPVDYVPTLGINTFNFTTPYYWDGTSDILIDICNGATNTLANNYFSENVSVPLSTTPNFTSSLNYSADDVNGVCNYTGTGNYSNLRPDIGFVWNVLGCVGTPKTKIMVSNNNLCSNNRFTLSDTATNPVITGINYQWQASIDSIHWTNANSTSKIYSDTQKVYTMFYRDSVTCTGSGVAVLSNIIKLTNKQYNTIQYANLPFTEGFETWANNSCANSPNNYWTQNIIFGGGAYWNISTDNYSFNNNYDYNFGSGLPCCFNTNFGASQGNYSARFLGLAQEYGHYEGNGYYTWYTDGFVYGGRSAMDLHINCNTPNNTKKLSFDFGGINNSGNAFSINISRDGGATFNKIDSNFWGGAWTNRTLFFNSSSPNTVIRFLAGSSADFGIDNIVVSEQPQCSGTPAPHGIKATTATTVYCSSQIISIVDTSVQNSDVTYQWQTSPDNINWTGIVGPTNTYYNTTIPFATKQYIRLLTTCAASGLSSGSNYIILTNREAKANLPFTETFDNTWINGCATADIPSNKWVNSQTNSSMWRNSNGTATFTNSNYKTNGSGQLPPHFANLDLYINCSSDTGKKALLFDYKYIDHGYYEWRYDSLFVMLSLDSGVTFTTLASYGYTQNVFTNKIIFNSNASNCVIRFKARASYNSYYSYTSQPTITIDNVQVIGTPFCSGKPTAGIVVKSPSSSNLQLSGTSLTSPIGINYQWYFSSDSIHWGKTNITDTSTSITPLSVYSKFYYRCVVGCSNSGLYDTSNVYTVLNPNAPFKPATIPYNTSFENVWITRNNYRGCPDSAWDNYGPVGTYANMYWQRHNSFSDGQYSAGFLSGYFATPSYLSLYVDCSKGDALKFLKFDYYKLQTLPGILISNDGGLTYSSPSFMYIAPTTVSNWSTVAFSFSSTHPVTIIQFWADQTSGAFAGSLIDNLKIMQGCPDNIVGGTSIYHLCNRDKVQLTVAGATSMNTAPGLKFQWQSSTDSITWTDITSATDSVYSTKQMTSTYYRRRTNCGGSLEAYSQPVFVNASMSNLYATLPYTESFETDWIDDCTLGLKVYPNKYWSVLSTTGNKSFRRSDDSTSANWTTPNIGAYTPKSSIGNYSARCHTSSVYTDTASSAIDLHINCNSTSTPKLLSFDYINKSNPFSGDKLQVLFSTDSGVTFTKLGVVSNTGSSWANKKYILNSNSGATVIRFLVSGYYFGDSTDIGIDNIVVSTAQIKYAIANGNWGDSAIWNDGVVPTINDYVVIQGYTVGLAGAKPSPYYCNSLSLGSAGSLSATANVLNIGAAGGDNKSLTISPASTLNISGGTINVNGSFLLQNAGNFIMSNGKLNIDGNAGTDAGSVEQGIDLFGIGTSIDPYWKLTGTFAVTGGVITIVDPHRFDGNYAMAYWNSTNYLDLTLGTGNTVMFGDSVSTQNSNTPNGHGFIVKYDNYNYPNNYGTLKFNY